MRRDAPVHAHVSLVGATEEVLRVTRQRLAIAALLFAFCFAVIGGQVVRLTVFRGGEESAQTARAGGGEAVSRAPVVDRNGVLLASSLNTASLYADARAVLDPERDARRLATVLPDLDVAETAARLASGKAFVWLQRNLTPQAQYRVNRLGIPALGFRREERRLYPHGSLAAHVLGYTDIDNQGIAGIERALNEDLLRQGGSGEAVALSLDVRVQFALHEELRAAMERFQAQGAAGVVLDAGSGEVLGMVSLPDFDPNRPNDTPADSRFNRISLGVYELGSVFKIFTVALGLESGVTSMRKGYDATHPIRISRFTIRDDHAKKRWLSVPEIFMYSSNIGAAKMALDAGIDAQRAMLRRLGLLSKPGIELSEVGKPLAPARWREINAMTIAFGHGVAVSPLQLASGVAAVVNGGLLLPPTLLKRDPARPLVGTRVLSEATSDKMRRLMRLVVEKGTGRQAEAKGYLVGGKTGTAEKSGDKGYRRKALLSSFVAAFPMHAPRYVVYVLLDEPKGDEKTFGFASAGWTAAPTVGRVINRIAPVLGVRPVDPESERVRQALAVEIPGAGAKLASY